MNMKSDDKYESLRTVKTNIGEMPIGDYLDIKAMQYGFDSYEDLVEQGYSIDIPQADYKED
jgi:hypothetical protein